MQIEISDLKKQIQNRSFFKHSNEVFSNKVCSNEFFSNKKPRIEKQEITDNTENKITYNPFLGANTIKRKWSLT